MKILKNGRKQKGWSKEFVCSGYGNGGGGCSAKLLVSEYDFYKTHSYHYDGSNEVYTTFTCPSCGVETDVENYKVPRALGKRPTESERKLISGE